MSSLPSGHPLSRRNYRGADPNTPATSSPVVSASPAAAASPSIQTPTSTEADQPLDPPLFTAVIAVHNAEQYLPALLTSIDAQTISRHSVEYIFVDDASTDASPHLVAQWALDKPWVHLYKLSANRGVAGARNLGYSRARGTWITSIDSDDVIDPHYFAEVARFINADELQQIDLISTRVMIVDHSTGIFKLSHPLDYRFAKGNRVVRLADDPTAIELRASSFMRTDVLRAAGLTFDPRVKPTFEDAHLVSRYLLSCNDPVVALAASARYYYRKGQPEASLVTGGWARPEKYTDQLEYGYLAALRAAANGTSSTTAAATLSTENRVQSKGSVPRWLENTILYDLSWYFEDGAKNDGASAWISNHPDLRQRFLSLLERIFALISVDAVRTFSIRPLPVQMRATLIARFYAQQLPAFALINSDGHLALYARSNPRHAIETQVEASIAARQLERPNRATSDVTIHAQWLFGTIFAYEALVPDNEPFALHDLHYADHRVPALDFSLSQASSSSPDAAAALESSSAQHTTASLHASSDAPGTQSLSLLTLPTSRVDPAARKSLNRWLRRTITQRTKTADFTVVAYRKLHNLTKNLPTRVRRKLLRISTKHLNSRLGTMLMNKYRGAWIIMDRESGANDNGEHFYRWLQHTHPEIPAYFLLRRDSPDYRRLKKAGVRFTPRNPFTFACLFRASQVHIGSDFTSDDMRVLRLATPQADTPPFVFLQHGITKDDISQVINKHRVDLLCTVLPQEQTYFTDDDSPYRFKNGEVTRTGFARFDRLLALSDSHTPHGGHDPHARHRLHDSPKQSSPHVRLLVMPTWRHKLRAELRKKKSSQARRRIFRDSQYFRQWDALLRSATLRQLVQAGELRIDFVAHPNMTPYFDEFAHNELLHVHNIRTTDVQQLLATADLFLTDYSSTAFDAAIAGCSVAYFQFDAAEFFGGAHTMRRGWFDYERDGFGPLLADAHSVQDWVSRAVRTAEGNTSSLPSTGSTPQLDAPQSDAQTHTAELAESAFATRRNDLRSTIPRNACSNIFEAIEHMLWARTSDDDQAAELRQRVATQARSVQPLPAKRAALLARDPHQARVAAILDQYSALGFDPECSLLNVMPHSWRTQLDAFTPDIFLCESAWDGPDPSSHPWRGKIYTRRGNPKENRTELLSILDYCQQHGIPTVFWNKEDPTHFDDATRNFVDTARLFDFVFTTDSACIPRYARAGIEDVHTLQFAVQPRLYVHPSGQEHREARVIFAGSWYNDLPERNAAMEKIFDSIIASPYELAIYDRHSADRHPNHRFPKKYEPFVHPAVSQEELAELYRTSLCGLTINTVTDSPTMYARRAFEIAASGAVVLSNYSLGVERDFRDGVIFLDRDPQALTHLTPDHAQRIAAQGMAVAAQHTYSGSLRIILARVLNTSNPQ
ncbi:MAG: glycosyltransferase [Actinomycetaceae bacterium]|nr:glycosyltransferase [Actinomycetaceae bacterium]MDY6082251.1 glycosyltransferase [Actinomycetaceae bacterium]